MDFKLAQELTTFFYEHRLAMNLLSASLSLVFAFVILLLLRRIKAAQNDEWDKSFKSAPRDEWAKPFAWAFIVLAILHLIPVFLSLLGKVWVMSESAESYVSVIVSFVGAVLSGLVNYLFFRAGIPLAGKSGKYSAKVWRFIKDRPDFARYIKPVVIILLAVAALTALLSDLKSESPQEWSDWWLLGRFPDVLFSDIALVFVGWVLYRSVSSRRAPGIARLARGALLVAVGYAVLYTVFGAHPLIVEAGWADWLTQDVSQKKLGAMDAVVAALSLPLKVGFFFPAFTLLLMIADPAAGIRRLLKNVTHGPDEFLDDNGVVRSIKEETKVSRVELYIRKPGTKSNKVVRYRFPDGCGVAGQPEELEFKPGADYGWVMDAPDRYILRGAFNYEDVLPDNVSLTPGASVIVIPVLSHGAVIGCLKAELDDDVLGEADVRNYQRFAALLTPSAQNYRQEEASKQLSHRLTNLQLEARDYQIERDIGKVAHIAQDILAPLATGISIRAGFQSHVACEPANADCAELMKTRLRAPDGSDASFLPEEMKVAWLDAETNEPAEQFIGMLLLAIPLAAARDGRPPTLVSNLLHNRVVSSLITDASLNFIRGSLNEVTRQLGIRMDRLEAAYSPGGPATDGQAAKQANVHSWLQTVNETAVEADLLWVVAKYSGEHEWLGGQAEVVKSLEGREDLWSEKVKHDEYANNLDIALCTLPAPEGGLSHVIRISLRRSEQVIWLGVGNVAFERELDYLSPWMGFVLRFGDIAHTNLKQILLKQQQERLEKEAAEAVAAATFAVMTGTFVHQMVNQVRDLTGPIAMLVDAVKRGRLQGNERHRNRILGLSESVAKIESLMKQFSGRSKADETRPCSLSEAYEHAVNLMRDSLARYNITVNQINLDTHVVDVPFYVAVHALANLMNNAKDAIREGGVRHGVIEVSAEPTGNMVLCHVTDNGPGVPPDLIKQLFKTRGNSSKPHGSGMGLYLSAHSLRENRGAIKVTSAGPSPPTTFTLCFPKERKD